MKKHLKALLAGAAVAGSILACTAAYARFSDSVTVTNHISVGDINISLRELEKKDGREMKYQDRRIVLPGDEISKIPRITNHSEPCWVRVKISYTDDLEGLDGLDDRNLTGMSPSDPPDFFSEPQDHRYRGYILRSSDFPRVTWHGNPVQNLPPGQHPPRW